MQISLADWNVIFAHPRSVRDSISSMTGGASGGIGQFFVSGRNLPWRLNGRWLRNLSIRIGRE
jgi:hypothetical protein